MAFTLCRPTILLALLALCSLAFLLVYMDQNSSYWNVQPKSKEIRRNLGHDSQANANTGVQIDRRESLKRSNVNVNADVDKWEGVEHNSIAFKPKETCLLQPVAVNDTMMMKRLIRRKKTVCPGKDWLYVDNGTLRFSPEVVQLHQPISCDYYAILRKNDLENTFAEAIKDISIPFTIRDDEFKITCTGKNGIKYENFHQGVPFRQSLVDRPQDPMKDGFEGMSIAILGFDSMSRMSWLRRLNVTRKYFVEKLGAIELEKHNVLGDGTTAVMFPMLTGKFEWELPECRRSHPQTAKPMDDFPWIWRDFNKAGYLTGWNNAKPPSAPFNWRFLGFAKKPTDFYTRTFYVSSFPVRKGGCIGSQSRHDLWLNYFRDTFHMYKKQRKFIFHFFTDMSHDDNNNLNEMDEPVQNLVQHLHDDGYLNNTLFIMMGDHGARHGTLRSFVVGKLEERLPYFSFLFPPWFLKKYPEAIRNLKRNTKRLTTPFDIYATFREFFNFTGTGTGDVLNRGISLFKEIPLERTCKQADIASHWCACLERNEMKTSDAEAKTALKTALDTINALTKNAMPDCPLLSVTSVTTATRLEMGNDFLRFRSVDGDGGIYKINFTSNHKNEIAFYQLAFYTAPGDGVFEVIVKRNLISNKYSLSEEQITVRSKTSEKCLSIFATKSLKGEL